MPTISKETLRAYVLLSTNGKGDYPSAELSLQSEPFGDDLIRFRIVHTTAEGTANSVFETVYVKGEHSNSHMERVFIDGVPLSLATMWADEKKAFEEARARFEKIMLAVEQADVGPEHAYPE